MDHSYLLGRPAITLRPLRWITCAPVAVWSWHLWRNRLDFYPPRHILMTFGARACGSEVSLPRLFVADPPLFEFTSRGNRHHQAHRVQKPLGSMNQPADVCWSAVRFVGKWGRNKTQNRGDVSLFHLVKINRKVCPFCAGYFSSPLTEIVSVGFRLIYRHYSFMWCPFIYSS